MRRVLYCLLTIVVVGCNKHDNADPASGANVPNKNILPNPDTQSVTSALFRGSTCKTLDEGSFQTDAIALTPIFPNIHLYGATAMQQPPDDSTRWFVSKQTGSLVEVPNHEGVQSTDVVTRVDLSSAIYATNEAGLLSFALAPDFAQTRTAYLTYTTPRDADPSGTRIVEHLARFVLPQGSGAAAAAAAGTIVLSQNSDHDFHLGGNIAFGPDQMLYFGIGFMGTGNDSAGNAQNMASWRGKMLRLDVSQPAGGAQYGVPADNPFVGQSGMLPEIFASGFRNPWRWSIDAATGKLWLGDVGQDAYEEVNIVAAGNNYGWPFYEGASANPNASTSPPAGATFTPPAYLYGHDAGACITGGYVYHGTAMPEYQGAYFFADCLAGQVWVLRENTSAQGYTASIVAEVPSGVVSFAQDNAGEIYILNRDGDALRLDPAPAETAAALPQDLKDTGCVSTSDATVPADKILAYEVQVPFWSDGGNKIRFVALPEQGDMQITADGRIDLPPGTVTVKDFDKDGQRIETRLMMRFSDESWAGITYQWNDAGTAATLVPVGGATRALSDGTTWRYPARSQCMACHNRQAGYALGWQVGQINTTINFADGSRGNQLDALAKAGFLDAPLSAPAASLTQYADLKNTSIDVQKRVKAYLQVNCALCHQPGGAGLGPADFRWSTAPADMNVCNAAPTYGSFGVANAKLMTPGNAATSVMSLRIHATDDTRMPPVSSRQVDTAGAALLDSWINQLSSCPQ